MVDKRFVNEAGRVPGTTSATKEELATRGSTKASRSTRLGGNLGAPREGFKSRRRFEGGEERSLLLFNEYRHLRSSDARVEKEGDGEIEGTGWLVLHVTPFERAQHEQRQQAHVAGSQKAADTAVHIGLTIKTHRSHSGFSRCAMR